MTDQPLDQRMDALFRDYAELGVRPIDRMAIAWATVATGRPAVWRRPSFARSWRVALIAALLAALSASVLWIAGHMLPMPNTLRVYRNELVAAPNLTTPRAWPSVQTLRDGRVLVLAGDNAVTKTAEVFDSATGTTVGTVPFPSGYDLTGSGTALLPDGSVLVVVGSTAATGPFVTAAPMRFNPDPPTFAEVGPMVIPRIGPSLTALRDGRVLVMGGIEPNNSEIVAIATAELFDPATAQFSLGGSAPGNRLRSSGLLLRDGRVLFIAWERFPSIDLSDMTMIAETYDPATGTFSDAGAGTGPGGIPVLLNDGRVLILGGTKGGPTARIWDGSRIVAAAAPPVIAATATVLDDGRILVTGSGGGPSNGNWVGVFEPASGDWIEYGASKAWHPAVAKLPDGRILLLGGLEDGAIHNMAGGGDLAPMVATMEYFQ